MMKELIDKLLAVDVASHWKPGENEDPKIGIVVLKRQFQAILKQILTHFGIEGTAYVAITRIQPGQFSPLVAIHRDLEKIAPSSLAVEL